MSLITDTGDASRLIKYLADAIPQGEHPNPYAEWISVRLDVVQCAIDHIEWLEKGNEEWRAAYAGSSKQATTSRAQNRIALSHLDAVLNKAKNAHDQQAIDTAARDYLASIGYEPS